MRREFVAVETAMRAFIKQPDYPTLIINAADNDLLFPTKILQNWDREWETHIFLLFAFECATTADYLQKCMELLKAQVDSVNQGRAEAAQDPWPALPLLCSDPRQPPAPRLLAAIEYVRVVLPDRTPVVWGLMPPAIGDADGYKAMINPLLARDGFEDWMDDHRFFIRDDSNEPFLLPELERDKVDSVIALDIDFSPARVADGLVQSVNDKSLPTPERMQALMQLAAFDLAHQRYEQALEKYDILHAYGLQEGDPVGQAMALGGAADVALRAGNNDVARKRYQQALAVAVPEKNLALMFNLLMGAGEACLRLKGYEEAEGYFDFADKVAGKLLNPPSKIDAMEKLGVAKLAGGKATEAANLWAAAKSLSLEFNDQEHARSLLDRLIALYSRSEMAQEARNCQLEKDSLGLAA